MQIPVHAVRVFRQHSICKHVKLNFLYFGSSITLNTGNDVYSGDRYSGNDRYSGLNPPDDAILFTVSRITAIADNFFGNFDKNDDRALL